MKLSTAYVVFAAFAAAAAPARADSAVSVLSDAFFRLIKTQTRIQIVEKRNDDFLSPALNNITRELHQGLNSNIFQTGMTIFNTLVSVNMKVGHIAGNATSMLTEIDSVALSVTTVHFSHARLDYDIKKNSTQKLCQVTLAKTNNVIQLIDETKEMIAKGVIGPLRMLQLIIRMTADEKEVRKEADIKLQQQIINNPFSNIWKPFTGYDAKEAAKALQQEDKNTIERIEKLVTSILDHATWLEAICQTIREQLDQERTDISKIEGNIEGNRETVTVITEEFDSQNMSDENLREGSKTLVQVMNNLRNEVFNITRNRLRRAAVPYYKVTAQPFQIRTDYSSQAVYLEQPVKPSWLD